MTALTTGNNGLTHLDKPILMRRAPTVNDTVGPEGSPIRGGRIWVNEATAPFGVWLYGGAGSWLAGGDQPATPTVLGTVMTDTLIDGTDDDTTVGTSKAIFDYGQTLVLAGANVATEAVQGIGELSSDQEGIDRTASTALKALFLTPTNMDPILASPSAIGSTAADSGDFTGLTADGTGTVTFVSNAAGLFDVTGAGLNLTLSSDAGRVIINAEEAAANAITLLSAAGGIDADAALQINIATSQNAADAIVISASAGGIDITATGAPAEDLDLVCTSGSVNISAGESAADSVTIISTAGGIDILASGAAPGEDIDIVATGSSVNISSDEGVANALRLNASAGGIDVDATAQINIASSQNAADSIVILSTAGGIDITCSGASAGEDIDILATGSSVNISATEDAARAMYLHLDGGVLETLDIHVDQGTNVASLILHSDVGGVTFESGLASADAININATDAAGGIDVDCGSAGFIVDAAAGAISLDSALASNFTVTGAVDLTLDSSAGSVNIAGGEAATDAVSIQAAAGGVDIDGILQVSIVSAEVAGNAIVIDASNAAGGIDMDCGSGGFALDAAAGAISLDSALASNFTVTGAVDLTLSSTAGSMVISGGEAVADAIQLQAAAGGVDLDGALQVNIASSQNAADAIRINASAGGIDIDAAGGAAEDINIDNAAGSINLTSGEAIANSMILSAGGGMDLLAPSGGAGLDIDMINTGGSINITATESTADAIVIDASGAVGAIQLNSGTGGVVTDSGRTINVTAKVNADTPYAVLGSDHDLTGDTSAGVLTFTLPAAPATGRSLIVYDIGGSAGANNITMDGNGNNIAMQGTTAATKVLAANYSSASLVYNGTIWMARYTA